MQATFGENMTHSSEKLLKTPCYNLHLEAGGKMVPFAGYQMPVQYNMGVKKEHLHTREKVGLFDVSHMGQLKLIGKNAAIALEKLVPVDIIDLPIGKQRYALFTNDQGGLLDDLMVSNFGDHLFVVVNAACKAQDIAHLQRHLPSDIEIQILENRALLAIQGPKTGEVLKRLIPESADMIFMDSRVVNFDGVECIIGRAGYTGEDGFEISIPQADAERIARLLLAEAEVEWIGLGARDSLRLESGLCLYGHDIDETTTPVEASLLWAISKVRRTDGERAGGFPGAKIILEQIATKNVNRKRIGMVGLGKAPVREGTLLYNSNDEKIGIVTSGTAGPTKGSPIAMGYVETDYAVLDTQIYADVRGKKLPMLIQRMPFVAQRYYRG
jgi:aminomethyltransferase